METTNYSVTIGKVTYRDFPTFSAISPLRLDVIKSMISFFRMLGICSLRQVNIAIGDPEDDQRAKWMVSREGGIPDEDDEAESEKNRKETEELQKTTLGEDDDDYVVSVPEVIALLQKSDFMNSPQKALRILLKQKQRERIEAPKPDNTAEKDLERTVMARAKQCFLSPVFSLREAKNTEGYLAKLIKYFPNVPTELIAAYLFFGKVSKITINAALKEAGVSRSRGFRVKSDSLIERTAFVYWTGGDWRKYYESGGKIEIKPQPADMEDSHIGRPKLNKTTRRPRTVQPKDTPQPKTTPQPKVEVASPTVKIDPINLSATRTSITITGTISEILKILTLINEHSK